MLSKCANPQCSASFQYLREGKLFQIDSESADGRHGGPQLVDGKRPTRRIEYFWLCGPCSSSMTLAYEKGKGVVTVPLQKAAAFRAAAS